MTMPPNPPSGSGLGGSGTVGIDVYGRRVRDDDAAPSLQPFLQRVARFRLEGGGSGASIQYPFYSFSGPSAFLTRYPATERGGQVDAQAEGYVGRWLYLAARVGFEYERWMPQDLTAGIGGFGNVTPASSGAFVRADSSEVMLHSAAAVGVRWRDLLLTAGWGVTAFRIADDALQVRFWGGAFIAGRAVVRRFVALAARVKVLDGGATAAGDVTVWLRRRFGLSAGVEGGHGAFADSPVVYDRAGGHVGLAWWLTPRAEIALAYAPLWQHATPVAGIGFAERDFSFVAHVISLTLTSRPPLSRIAGR